MSSFYNVGLQNVGSYQVAGIPFASHYGPSTSGEVVYFEFPNVSKSIYMHFDDNANGHSVDYAFCEPKRAINFGGTSEYLNATFSATNQLTFSTWVKLESTISGVVYVEILGANGARIQTTGTSRLRIRVNAQNSDSTTLIGSAGDWVNLTLTVNGTTNKIYLNGNFVIESTADAGSGHNELSLGGDSASGYDGIYDEAVLFSTAFSDDEVLELYNEGRYLKTSNHSRVSDLVSRWDFEDNNYKSFYSTPDTTSLIYDRISGNNLSLVGSTPLTFVDGRLIENALDRHSLTETGHQELTLNCKAKGILARFNDNNDELSVFASLTNIPASRMYDLTGPGIDE